MSADRLVRPRRSLLICVLMMLSHAPAARYDKLLLVLAPIVPPSLLLLAVTVRLAKFVELMMLPFLRKLQNFLFPIFVTALLNHFVQFLNWCALLYAMRAKRATFYAFPFPKRLVTIYEPGVTLNHEHCILICLLFFLLLVRH